MATVADLPDGTLDLVIGDGRARVESGLAAMDKVRPGGMLLLDDSDRPRDQPLADALTGWRRTTHTGLKIGGGINLCERSVWKRPA